MSRIRRSRYRNAAEQVAECEVHRTDLGAVHRRPFGTGDADMGLGRGRQQVDALRQVELGNLKVHRIALVEIPHLDSDGRSVDLGWEESPEIMGEARSPILHPLVAPPVIGGVIGNRHSVEERNVFRLVARSRVHGAPHGESRAVLLQGFLVVKRGARTYLRRSEAHGGRISRRPRKSVVRRRVFRAGRGQKNGHRCDCGKEIVE